MEKNSLNLRKMPDKEYFALPKLSNSAINTIKTAGIESYYYNTFGLGAGDIKPENPNYTLGSLVHCLILEPMEFESRYIISTGKAPVSTNMKAFCDFVAMGMNPIMSYKTCYQVSTLRDTDIGKKAEALLLDMEGYIKVLKEQRDGDRKIITEEVYKQGVAMTESFSKAYPALNKRIITNEVGTYVESVGICTDGLCEYKFKADLIIIRAKNELLTTTIYDIKTTECVGERSLIETIDKWNYKQQAAFYTNCLSLCAGIDLKDINFSFIFISKIPPYSVTTVEMSFNTLLRERATLRNWLKDNHKNINEIQKGNVTNKPIII